jgi:Zn-dependent protease
MDFNISKLLLLAPPILLALTFHEFAHAYVANRFGDDTAKQSGRLTMNPLAHLDPFGTIMIFIVHFGWAKPVPVNPYNLRNPKKDMLWISAAGPFSNMVLALISGLLLRFITTTGMMPDPHSMLGVFVVMVVFSLQINGWLQNLIRDFTRRIRKTNLSAGTLRSVYPDRVDHFRSIHGGVYSGQIDLALCDVFQQPFCRNMN